MKQSLPLPESLHRKEVKFTNETERGVFCYATYSSCEVVIVAGLFHPLEDSEQTVMAWRLFQSIFHIRPAD